MFENIWYLIFGFYDDSTIDLVFGTFVWLRDSTIKFVPNIFLWHRDNSGTDNHGPWIVNTWCVKITENVSFNIASKIQMGHFDWFSNNIEALKLLSNDVKRHWCQMWLPWVKCNFRAKIERMTSADFLSTFHFTYLITDIIKEQRMPLM